MKIRLIKLKYSKKPNLTRNTLMAHARAYTSKLSLKDAEMIFKRVSNGKVFDVDVATIEGLRNIENLFDVIDIPPHTISKDLGILRLWRIVLDVLPSKVAAPGRRGFLILAPNIDKAIAGALDVCDGGLPFSAKEIEGPFVEKQSLGELIVQVK